MRKLCQNKKHNFLSNSNKYIVHSNKLHSVRPRDTRPRAAWASQVHVFELGPKRFEMNEFM